MINKKKKFKQICKDIKSIKIQGARNVALAAFKAYKLIPTPKSKEKLLKLRPTEPLLHYVLNIADDLSYKELKNKINENQDKINKSVLKLIKSRNVVFTHCHSSTVVNSLIYAKSKKKKFEVYNTETRPLYQGRKTARELKKAGIEITMFTDSAVNIALTNSQETKDVDLVFLGVDAILKKGVLNKVGSGMIANLANDDKIPVYIVADSWKYSKHVKIEQRNPDEIWENHFGIKIKNPAFELVPKKFIKGIISEYGILSYDKFLKKIKK
jgi:translation initiation factor 2B subunit (eIF-2B alpha/beta/delta family)